MGGVAGSCAPHRLIQSSQLTLRTVNLVSGAFVAIPINARLMSQSYPDNGGTNPSRFPKLRHLWSGRRAVGIITCGWVVLVT